MARLLLLIAIAIPLWIGWKRFKSLPVAQQKTSLWQVLVAALIGALLLLALTGRLPWLMALFAALIPALRAAAPALLRLLPGLLPTFLKLRRSANAKPAPDADGHSTVTTDWLALSLDHQSGEISGTVRQGAHQGRSLHDLSQQELMELYRCCVNNDANSAQLLSSYLEQRLGPGWQDHSAEQPVSTASGTMSQEEARAILGLDSNATREQILAAHRRLIQKLHPDRGGNDYLAAQLNRARDCLLG